MEMLAYVIYGNLEYLTAIWHTLWPFDMICGHFPQYWYDVPRKIWHP
jgi:hypothetical protein